MAMRDCLDALDDDRCLTVDELMTRTRLTRKQVAADMNRLVQRGYVERVERGCFQLTAEGRAAKADGRPITPGPNARHTGPRTPPRKTLTRRVWRAVRATQGKRFTVEQILEVALTDGETKGADVRRYLGLLARAGHLRRFRRRRDDGVKYSNGQVVYALIRDTGPEHPIPRQKRTILHDPNTGERIDLTKGAAQ